jgi:predicted RNA-binding Zn ribbon-like protein
VDALWLELLNSDWHDFRGRAADEDRLDSPAWRERFLARCGLPAAPAEGGAARRALRDLRTLLRRMTEALRAGRQPAARDLAELNRVLAAAPMVRKLTRDARGFHLELAAAGRDLRAVRAEVARSFAEFISGGDPRRISLCANPDCRWVFVDASHNRTRRWCDPACGNLVKVRRFRARQRATRAGWR